MKRNGNTFTFSGKASGPDSTDAFHWGYAVKKGDFVVEVSMEDARDKTIFSGYYPPRLEDWVEKGWEVMSKSPKRVSVRTLISGDAPPANGSTKREQGTKFDDLPE